METPLYLELCLLLGVDECGYDMTQRLQILAEILRSTRTKMIKEHRLEGVILY
jgi:hypothetical protein